MDRRHQLGEQTCKHNFENVGSHRTRFERLGTQPGGNENETIQVHPLQNHFGSQPGGTPRGKVWEPRTEQRPGTTRESNLSSRHVEVLGGPN